MADAQPVLSLYDEPFWAAMAEGRLELQSCASCARFRYPPAPVCPDCLSMDYAWTPVSGRGEILSWVIFHRQYFDDFPPPYNAIAVRLEEGPILVSNLMGIMPVGNWIGEPVQLTCRQHEGRRQHAFEWAGAGAEGA